MAQRPTINHLRAALMGQPVTLSSSLLLSDYLSATCLIESAHEPDSDQSDQSRRLDGESYVATGSGRRVAWRARVAAVLSWPQAAWIALPFVSRTVTGKPSAASASRKASTRAREDG